MITWMQKHKKWLIITIWISAIAFIGAGGFGWGDYTFGSSANSLAKVGKIHISIDEFNRLYSDEFNRINQMLGGKLDEEQAKAFGLKSSVAQRLILRAKILNFADELNLSVSDKEVGDMIVNVALQNNIHTDDKGNFDLDLYKKNISQRLGMPISEFEEQVRGDILSQKVASLIGLDKNDFAIYPLEKRTFASLDSMQDEIELLKISTQDLKIDTSDSVIKPFWEQNKNLWNMPIAFDIEYSFIENVKQEADKEEITQQYDEFKSEYLDANGELMSLESAFNRVQNDVKKNKAQTQANREFVALRDGKNKGIQASFNEFSKYLNLPFLQGQELESTLIVSDLKTTSVGNTIRPIELQNGFIVIKLLNKSESSPKTYEDAKQEAIAEYTKQAKKDKLKELADSAIASGFNGKYIGFVDLHNVNKKNLLDLDKEQESALLKEIFTAKNTSGYVLLSDTQAILYKIISQTMNLKSPDSVDTTFLSEKKRYITELYFLDYLDKTYKTTLFVDLNK